MANGKSVHVVTSSMVKKGGTPRALATAAPPLPRNVAGQNRRGTGNKGMYGR